MSTDTLLPPIGAVVVDGRLISESVEVNEVNLEQARDSVTGKLQVEARSTISNRIRFEDKVGPQQGLLLIVDCAVDVRVNSAPNKHELVKYESKYRCAFEVYGQATRDAAPTVEQIAPYVAQANWLAIRRADGSLAVTGVAQLRLNVPLPDVRGGTLHALGILAESLPPATKTGSVKRRSKSHRKAE